MYHSKFTPSVLNALKNKLFVLLLGTSLLQSWAASIGETPLNSENPIVGANRTEIYFPLLKNKRVGLVANPTSVIFKTNGVPVHLADSLLNAGVNLVRVFTPEHGFRGLADAGEELSDSTDPKTGLPLVSLYGNNRKPQPGQLNDLDLVIFDIQDLGVRFYTYIATLQLVMEACAENEIPFLVLDRPNPNADLVDGPVMEPEHQSFLGMTPIPLAYGMTVGEYATLLNEEGWLSAGVTTDLTVIEVLNYNRQEPYDLPIPPSPNIPNTQSARLYPSLGLFEGTRVNAGRGTGLQFQCFGAPFLSSEIFDFKFTPESRPGAKSPKHQGNLCYGRDLSRIKAPRRVNLEWLLEAYHNRKPGTDFFLTNGFTKHAGTALLQKQIEDGLSVNEIRETWKPSLDAFLAIRSKYLRYP